MKNLIDLIKIGMRRLRGILPGDEGTDPPTDLLDFDDVGGPMVWGTQISAKLVIDLILEGWTWHDILKRFPELTADDIRACLALAIRRKS